jgi:hypothetical protein
LVAAEAAVGFVEDYVLVDFCADLVRLSIFRESGGMKSWSGGLMRRGEIVKLQQSLDSGDITRLGNKLSFLDCRLT